MCAHVSKYDFVLSLVLRLMGCYLVCVNVLTLELCYICLYSCKYDFVLDIANEKLPVCVPMYVFILELCHICLYSH